jgi:hypothetical protein
MNLPALRSPRSALRAPRSALRAPRSALRAPRSALRAPRSALRAPALRSPLSAVVWMSLVCSGHAAADTGELDTGASFVGMTTVSMNQADLHFPDVSVILNEISLIPEIDIPYHQSFVGDGSSWVGLASAPNDLFSSYMEISEDVPVPTRVWIPLGVGFEVFGVGTRRDVRGGASWFGHPLDDPHGLVVFSKGVDGVRGTIVYHGTEWKVEPSSVDSVDVYEVVRESVGSSCGSGDEDSLSVEGGVPFAAATSGEISPGNPCGLFTEVDVHIIFTHGAADDRTDDQMWADAQHRVNVTNAGFIFSSIKEQELSLRLVGVSKRNLGNATGSTSSSVDALSVGVIHGCRVAWPNLAAMDPLCHSVIAEYVLASQDEISSGADIVVSIMDDDSSVGISGQAVTMTNFLTVPDPGGGTCETGNNQDRPYATVRSLTGPFLHEVSHLFGAGHGRWTSTAPAFGDNSAYLAPDCSFVTDMGNLVPSLNLQECVDIPECWLQANACNQISPGGVPAVLFNLLSNTCSMFGNMEEGPLGSPPLGVGGFGFGLQATGDDDNEGVRIMREVAPIVAAYRNPTVPSWEPARLTSHENGDPLDGVVLLTWSPEIPPGPGQYRIEVGTVPGSSNTWSSPLLTSNSIVTSSLPAMAPGDVRFLRLWTNMSLAVGPVWVHRDYAFGYSDRIVSCSDLKTLASGSVPGPAAGLSCDSAVAGVDVCKIDASDHILCTLEDDPGNQQLVQHPWMQTATRFNDSDKLDFAAWGVSEGGAAFCCGYKQRERSTGSLEFKGSQRGDYIQARICNDEELKPISGPATVLFDGNRGPDKIIGSNYVNSYVEYMSSGKEDDVLDAGGGNDFLGGGDGQDFLLAGAGDDMSWGGGGADHMAGGAGADVQYGEDGIDWMCDSSDGDELDAGAGEDYMYWDPGSLGGATADGNAGSDGAICADPGVSWTNGCTNFLPSSHAIWQWCWTVTQ